jgi:ankyrin repeat protein
MQDELTALVIACHGGHLERVLALLEAGARVAQPAAPVLMLACQGGHAECVRALLEAGAPVEQTMLDTTELMLACQCDRLGCGTRCSRLVHRWIRPSRMALLR